MKEKIVIEETKEFRPHPALREGVNCIDTKYCKYEKVPTNWEELVELCTHYEDIEIGNGIIRIVREDRGNIEIYSLDGTIACNEYLLAEDRTIPQIWEIIKNLMEDK